MGGCGWVRVVKARRSCHLYEARNKDNEGSSQGGKDWRGSRCLADSVTLTSQTFLTTRPPETHLSYGNACLPWERRIKKVDLTPGGEKRVTYGTTL